MSIPVQPAYVTFTGVDDVALVSDLKALSKHFPIEWGVLIHTGKFGEPLFPSLEEIRDIASAGLRLSAHVCGEEASQIAASGSTNLDLAGFARAQINHGFEGSTPAQVRNCAIYGASQGIRVALQCQGEFPDDRSVDWLYDVSFGEGKTPGSWPTLRSDIPFCGLSGGLNAENVKDVLQQLSFSGASRYWIDMESGVRTDGRFDVAKCEAVCRAVFG